MTSKITPVSIGLPVRNGERYLRQTLDSILAQTYEDFELLISDNASTDRTQDICREYANSDSRIRYIRNSTNVGLAQNFNNLFKLSSGRYFRWHNADDLIAPTSLERCVAVLEGNDDVVVCYPRSVLIDEVGNTIRYNNDNLDLRSPNVCERFRWALDKIGMVNPIYGLIRSNVLTKTSLIGNYPSADQDLLIELCLYGLFFEIPDALFFRRMHSESYTALKTDQGRQEYLDPKTCGRIHLNHWRRMFQWVAAVWCAPLKSLTKLHLSYIVARAAVTARKELFIELLHGLREMSERKRLANQ